MNVPWFELIEIDIADDIEINLLADDLFAEVVVQELLLRRMEAKARGHAGLAVNSDAHLLLLLSSLSDDGDNELTVNYIDDDNLGENEKLMGGAVRGVNDIYNVVERERERERERDD